MRILLVGVAAIALSGCSWLGLGGSHSGHDYNQNSGYYKHKAHKKHSNCGDSHCLARWNLEASAGPDFTVGGKALTGNQTHNDPRGVINNVSMNNAFDTGYRTEIGGSYALTPNRKVTANGFYSEANGKDNVNIGTFNDEPLNASFGDYTSYGAEVGIRQYAHPRKGLLLNSVRPYVEGKIGGAYVEDIHMRTPQLGQTPLYNGGWVPTAAGMVGVETPVLPQMTLGLESGIRYTGKIDSDTSVLSGGNVFASGANRGSDRWSVPVMLRGRYRF